MWERYFTSTSVPFSLQRSNDWTPKGVTIQPPLREKRKVFCRVEIGMSRPADDQGPFFRGKFITVLAINILPDTKFRSLGIENKTVKVKDQSLYHG